MYKFLMNSGKVPQEVTEYVFRTFKLIIPSMSLLIPTVLFFVLNSTGVDIFDTYPE